MRAELKDFSGGITESIFTADPTCGEIFENFNITKDKDLETRWGSRVLDPNDSRPAVAVTVPSGATEFQDYKIFFFGGQILTWHDSLGWTEIIGYGAPNKCLTEGNLNSSVSYFEWNKHLFCTDNQGSESVKIFRDNLGNFKCVSAGLPDLASNPLVTPSVDDGKSYIYSFLHKYTYQVGDVTHIDYGPVTQVRVTNAADMSGSTNEISLIPTLANTPKTHYDTANIKIEIYRTPDTGTESYLVSEVANGTTTFSDSLVDDDLVLNQQLYIDSGAPDNDKPPVSKYIDICNNSGWYVNIDGYPYRALQSQIGDCDSVPSSYYVDFEEELRGWSSYQSNPVAFTENQIWRVEGVINLNGEGEHRKVMVTESGGLLNHSSIVKTPKGIFYAGLDSFYWTDGYAHKKIPNDEKNFPARYRAFAGNASNIKGSFDRLNNRIKWTTKTSATKYEIFVYDITFNAFTTWRGQPDDFKTVGILCSKDGLTYRADESGYIFVHERNEYSDPIIDLGTPPNEWQSYPVINHFRHIAFDYGVSDVNKWVTRITISGEGKTNLDVAIHSYDDSLATPKELVPLKHKSGLVWSDSTWLWSESEDVWNVETRLIQTRYFKHGKIRSKRKQIDLKNAIVTLTQSYEALDNSKGLVDATAKTITIIDPSLVYIPDNAIGMTMVVNGIEYTITDSGVGTFELDDPFNTLVDGNTHWSIVGYPQNQRFHLDSIIYTYEPMDDKGGYYQRGVSVSET